MRDFLTMLRWRAQRVLFAFGIIIAVDAAIHDGALTSGFDWQPFLAGLLLWYGSGGWVNE